MKRRLSLFGLGLMTIACVRASSTYAGPSSSASLPSPVATSTAASPLAATTTAVPSLAPTAGTAASAIGQRADSSELLYDPGAPASAQNPAFSPDGQTILFTLFHKGYNVGPAGLYFLSVNERRRTVWMDDPDQDNVNSPGASWNAVTGRITFASDRSGTEQIWLALFDGRDLTRVTHRDELPPYLLEPSISPDGQWIVFEAARAAPNDQRQGSLWRVRPDGSGLMQLTDGPSGGTDDRQPNWSPVGDRILFQRRIPGRDNWSLWTIASDGTNTRRVSLSLSGATDASWSPDGRWIVYSSDAGQLPAPNLFVIAAAGGEPLRLTHDAHHGDGAASWSPDGKWIAFESYRFGGQESPASLWRIAAPPLR